ncbi:MAG: lysophospholipase [Burkholderiaceae bacterium]|nr:lysophospholipase [Burkholderiaceae bacterium]
MTTPETFTLARPDGVELHGLCWRPPVADAAASRTVVIVHGLGEHVGRYATLGDWLAARGWTLRGHDHRGHGRSQGARGKLSSSHDLVDDLAAAIDALAAPASAPPLLMGHSMGGLVALTYALRHPERIGGLVLSSPALALGLGVFQKALLAVMSRVAPDVAVNNGLDPSRLSHDAAVVRAYVDDPLVHDRISARLARFLVDGGRDALERAPALSVPTLLIYAGDDRLVDPEGSREFARRAPRSLLVAREYPALWHEILNESPEGRSAVLADLERWLAQRNAPGAADASPSG